MAERLVHEHLERAGVSDEQFALLSLIALEGPVTPTTLAGQMGVPLTTLADVRVSPATGAVLGQTEIGPAGVDVRSDGSNLWVVAYEQAAEVRGDPVVGAVLRMAADGSVISSVTPTKRLFADGVAASGAQLWLLDSVAGLLLRPPA